MNFFGQSTPKQLIWVALGLVLVIGLRFKSLWQDQLFLLTYQPPERIAQLARETRMTDQGKRLFFVSTPEIVSGKDDLKFCQKLEKTVVLGCYSTQQGIFLKNVQDARLKGVMEVTAAHEMLHVAYFRLDSFQRRDLDQRLATAFEQVKNSRIRTLIHSYEQQNPEVVSNELHSILGTEIRHLNSPELEAHYRQYFSRDAVLALAEKVEDKFASIETETKKLDQQLDRQKTDLERLTAQVKQEKAEIAQENDNLEALRQELDQQATQTQSEDTGGAKLDLVAQLRQSQSSFNQRVADFNERVRQHNELVADLRARIATYNETVGQYNAIAREGKSLVEAIQDPTATPSPQPSS